MVGLDHQHNHIVWDMWVKLLDRCTKSNLHAKRELRAAPHKPMLKPEVQYLHSAAQTSSKRSCSKAEQLQPQLGCGQGRRMPHPSVVASL